jgi:serine/threonine protein kinase
MTSLQSVGNYDLLDKIAEGGMGAIYRGRNRATSEIVAIKIMPPHMASNDTLLKRFEQEFRVANRLDHANIVRALDFGTEGNTPYLVMEFVDGESLGQRIERDGPIPEVEAIRIIAQVAQGLHRAHKLGLIHRDVKPDNILITRDGVAKLADLGLVKEQEADLNLTKTGRGLGTPHFMAPEQFRNAKGADARCDIYSLGATLYMMVTGELPFKSSGPLDAWMKKIHNELVPPRELVPALSDRLDWAILRAMHADPVMRPPTCREFIEDLTGHSTRRVPVTQTGGPGDLWYLVYRDEEGEQHTVKGGVGAIRRSLKEGLLGDAANIRASRSKQGPFEPLRTFPEFRDLVLSKSPSTPAPVPTSRVAPPPVPMSAAPTDTVMRPVPESPSSSRSAGTVPTSRSVPAVSDEPHLVLPGEDHSSDLNWFAWALLFAGVIGGAIAITYLSLTYFKP